MGPYRTPAPPTKPPEAARARGDDWLIYAMLLFVGLVRVLLAIVEGEVFRAESTIAGLLAAAGLLGLVRRG